MKKAYWYNYYNNYSIVGNQDLQKNVGRTKNGQSIKSSVWKQTVNYIKEIAVLNEEDVLLELCCGNGQIIGYLADYCKSAIGVDFSNQLLKQLNNNFPKVTTLNKDVLELEFEPEKFNSIIFYFSIQHFTERESLLIIKKAIDWLKVGGTLLIGDIPNELKKWDYINKPQYQKDYLQRVLANEPMIGNWFNPGFFRALTSIFTNIESTLKPQPSYQINSAYRYDVLIKKNTYD